MGPQFEFLSNQEFTSDAAGSFALASRDQLDPRCRWNVENYFESESAWEESFAALTRGEDSPLNHLHQRAMPEEARDVRELLEAYFSLEYRHVVLVTYAHLRHDENTACDRALDRTLRAQNGLHHFRQITSWIQPALIALGPRLNELAKSQPLKPYRVHLTHLLRLQAHTLSADREALVALAEKPMDSPALAFRAFNDADLQFDKVRDSAGRDFALTQGTYSQLMRHSDRELRRAAYRQVHASYRRSQHTLSQLLAGTCESHLFFAKSRGYKSCLHAALYPQSISPVVYHTLIDEVRARSKALQRYLKVRQKLMKIERLEVWDLQAPLFEPQEKTWSFEEAGELIAQACAPLGSEFQATLQRGLFQERWIDRCETPRKRSGAYSSGCWGHLPLILLNYHESLQDVFTLAHELGHSMHSYLSWQSQPYHQSEYSIFAAEVASSLCEELLFRHLLQLADTKKARARLIYQRLEDLRATLFRQTLFAEFEWRVHDKCEKGETLTPGALCSLYRSLWEHYYGDVCAADTLVEIEWARIPHFHFNFYVFQYATGISAALDLSRQLMSDTSCRARLLNFLRSGGSKYPLQQLKEAGVDMASSRPVRTALDLFERYVRDLEDLIA